VSIPLNQLTVICGPSGSGKSSLAFETLFAEGQRRFIESMNTYARQFLNKAPKPDVEGVENIPPAIAIEQKNSIRSSRSTVGTVTELTDYLRILFEKLGEAHCPTHHTRTIRLDPTTATDRVLSLLNGKRGYLFTEIKRAPQASWKQQLGTMISQGFTRIALKKSIKAGEGSPEILELTDYKGLKKALCKDDFFILIDRISISKENQMRIFDSVKDAYEAHERFGSDGPLRSALILTTEGELLPLREAESCPECDYSPPERQSSLFSFNSPLGACATCKGFGNILTLDPLKVVPNPKLSIKKGALNPFTMPSSAAEKKDLFVFCKKNNIDLEKPWNELKEDQQQLLWTGGKGFLGVEGLFESLEHMKYKMHVRVFISRYRSPFLCPDCKGARLRKESLNFIFRKKNINDLSAMRISEIRKFFADVELTDFEKAVAVEILRQVNARLEFLDKVGISYLAVDRETKTLSGGEFQRIMLANQLGSGLSQTLYVLDEPTIGLHPRDNDRLISILHGLKDLGNTLVIVEHDHDVIASSQHVLEMGPGSGTFGGEVVFAGPSQEFFKSEKSLTASYFRPSLPRKPSREPRSVAAEHRYRLEMRGCTGHNLRNLDVDIPLNRLVAVTGVSGSGKTTLITRTLYPILAAELGVEHIPALPIKSLDGVGYLKNVLLIDQSPIGKTARSSPVTYLKAFDAIRTLMAQVPESKTQGYTAGTFSLNVDGGRCPSCKGTGFEEIDMMFMDNVVLPCDACDGKKYRKEILEVLYKGKNVFEILSMTVADAMQFFINVPQVRKPLAVLKEVGLDYLALGQPASTLSGGESQRLKIAKELTDVQQKSTLYILDEPTTGLHFREIELLLKVLHRLVDSGASVLVIEHNLDVIREADYVIDLGPDAGPQGGKIVALGSPAEICKSTKSLTGQYLKDYVYGKAPAAKTKSTDSRREL
jgi:excinuclease ABC subunit A